MLWPSRNLQFAIDNGAEEFDERARENRWSNEENFLRTEENAREGDSKEYNVAEGSALLTKKIFDITIKQGEFFPTVKVIGQFVH